MEAEIRVNKGNHANHAETFKEANNAIGTLLFLIYAKS